MADKTSTPTPAPAPAAEVDHGFIAKAEKWFEGHVAPDLKKALADIGEVQAVLGAHSVNVAQLAHTVVTLLGAVAPGNAAALAAVEAQAQRVLDEAKRIAEKLTGSAGVG